ncbi:MAG: ribosome-associated translation inhibitor RaiA [Alphaproteobacteria bacterium]|nr:ribosome-associated translation inhibitor RaiA [Alphaproteobacteria bacterium]
MEIQVTGKNMDLGDALQVYVQDKLEDGVTKYFERGADAIVTFTKERHLIECEMTAHLASGVFLTAHDEADDAYGAFDRALAKLEKRVRRYKRRLKDHHATAKDPLPAENAAYFTLASPSDEDAASADEGAPLVIAESTTKVVEMTVSAAVMQLDLVDDPAIMFKNAATGALNVVYRRRDGHIGWIDPTR